MADAYYVYGIQPIESPPPSGLAGFDGSPVVAIRCHALVAAASVIDAEGVRPTPDNFMKHEEIVEALQLAGPLLPARFGTVLPSDKAVVDAMTKQYSALLADLARVGGKVELGLTVLWSMDGAAGEERDQPTDEEGKSDAAPPVGDGTRYLKGRLIEFQREARLRTRAQSLARDIENTLGCMAIESNYAVLPTPRLAVRAAYLVEPSQTEAFRGAFEELRGACPGLHFLLSGPWPPYSFITRSGADVRSGDLGEPSPFPKG